MKPHLWDAVERGDEAMVKKLLDEGRDADEAAALDTIRRKDDTINAGLDEIDSMLDALGGDARRMNAQVRRQNSRLGVMNEALEESEARTARVNARARHNVGYYGRPDL